MKKILLSLFVSSVVIAFSPGSLQGTWLDPQYTQGRSLGNKVFPIYFPIILKNLKVVLSPPLAEVDVTLRQEYCDYSSPCWVLGYVNSLVTEPVYSVTVGIDMTIFPYSGPGDEPVEPYVTTEFVNPAFPATLHGQKNPFSWFIILGKTSFHIDQVRIISANLSNDTGEDYYPLTILDWHREGNAVIGKIRNDSGLDLENARVIIASNFCDWKEATLERTGLPPGQRTDFQLDYFYCEGEDVVVMGQGRAE